MVLTLILKDKERRVMGEHATTKCLYCLVLILDNPTLRALDPPAYHKTGITLYLALHMGPLDLDCERVANSVYVAHPSGRCAPKDRIRVSKMGSRRSRENFELFPNFYQRVAFTITVLVTCVGNVENVPYSPRDQAETVPLRGVEEHLSIDKKPSNSGLLLRSKDGRGLSFAGLALVAGPHLTLLG
ncbi:hypothetical protein BJV74DRAFT_794583 [Russula compacta]|nr:hypothetical protein BJV74DRAFT_794583 [Russula compacta]